jgi:hypothetical protein
VVVDEIKAAQVRAAVGPSSVGKLEKEAGIFQALLTQQATHPRTRL